MALALALVLSNSSVEAVLAAPETAGTEQGYDGILQTESISEDADQAGNITNAGEAVGGGSDTYSIGTDIEPGESTGDTETGGDTEADGSTGTGGNTDPDDSHDNGEEDPEPDNSQDHIDGTDITDEDSESAREEEEGVLDADSGQNGESGEAADENGESGDAEGMEFPETLSEEEIAVKKAMEPENLPVMDVLEVPEHYDASENPYSASYYTEASSFDSREAGILSQVRNQNPWGTCWAFTTLGVLEASLAMQGLADPAMVDLAERHLVYFTYHTGYDVLGNADKDTVELINGTNYMEKGGNLSFAALRLINWQGAAAESVYPYPNVREMPEDLALENAQDDISHMRNYFYVDTQANDSESIQNVKALVREYGCAGWSYYHDNSNFNYNTNAYYNNTQTKTNHAITIVGWDDDFPKENFKKQPQNNGAWIVRNSWGADWGEDGYFYISYEDTSLGSGNAAGVMVAEPAEEYDNNYFNSNTLAWDWQSGSKMAQVFTIKGLSADGELLRAVSFMTGSTNKDFEIQIYKISEPENGVLTDPEDGMPVLAEPLTGRTSYAGVYTVDLPEPVACNAGDIISIVISFPDAGYGYIYKDSSKDGNNIVNHNETQAGESFYAASSSGGWVDMHEKGESLRINLLTDDMTADVPLTVDVSVVSPEKAEEDYLVDFRWNKLTNVSEYEVYRAKALDGPYEKIGCLSASVRQYRDMIKQADYAEHYYYKIRALFFDGSDRYSEPVEAALEAKLFFGSLTLSCEEYQAKLSWDAVIRAAGYEIQRKEKNEAVYSLLTMIEDPSVTEYTDDLGAEEMGIYQYRIRAYNETGTYTDWVQEEIGKDLVITQTDYQHLRLFWLPMEGAAYCRVYVRAGSFYHTSEAFPVQGASLDYDVSGLLNSGQYRVGDLCSYYLVLEDGSGSELYRTSEISFQILPDALQIESLEIEDGNLTGEEPAVILSWKGGGGADTIVIYRSENPERWGEAYATVPAKQFTYRDTGIMKGKFYYYRLSLVVQNCAGETIVGEMTEYREILVPGEAGESVGYIVTPRPGDQIQPDEQNPDTLLTARVACAETVKIQFSAATKHGREILTASYDESKDLWTAVLMDSLLPGFGEGAGTVTLLGDGKKLDVVDVRFRAAGGNDDAGDTGDEGDNGDEDTFFREGIWLKDIPEQVYTGKALKPETAVYDDGSLLTMKKDYTVTYQSNINAGTAKVVIKGKGNYAETVEGSFVIRPRSLDQVSVTVPEYLIFNNREQKINVTVRDGRKKLSAKKDFTQRITYQGAVVEKAQAAGIYEITITGRGNYEGTVTVRCEVVEGKELLSKAVVKLPGASLPYRDGEEVTFDDSLISVKLGGKTVPRQEADGTVNYAVSYQDNKYPGTALVTITAEPGSHYVGSSSKKFKVLGSAFSARNIEIQGIEPKKAYTGDPVVQTLMLTDKATGDRLEEKVDYQIDYTNNVKAGKAGIILTGLGKYSGTVKKTFTITKVQLTEEMIGTGSVTAQQNRAGATPDIEITYCGKKLLNGQDYTLSYRNNKNITTETKKAYITVTGKGSFTGRLKDVVELNIQPKSWQSGDITIEVPDMKYSRNKKEYKPVPVVRDNGRKLVKNKDYTVSYELNQKSDIGTIPDTGHTARVVITAKSADYADGTADDIRTVEFRIMEKMIGNARVLLVDPQYFSRYGVKPGQDDLRVTYQNTPLSAQEYEILSYNKNDRKGKAVLVIGGKGQYGGTKKVTFVIRAKGMKTNLADAVSNAVSVLMELFA